MQQFGINHFRFYYEGFPPEMKVFVGLVRMKVDGEMAGGCLTLGPRGLFKTWRSMYREKTTDQRLSDS